MKTTIMHKPIIETILNTSAIALTSFGVMQITTGTATGYIAVSFGIGLELLKYWGRNKNLWGIIMTDKETASEMREKEEKEEENDNEDDKEENSDD